MILHLRGAINEDMLSNFILDVKEVIMSEKQVMQVMLNSEGGDVMVADALRSIIEDLQLPLVAYKQISSAAMYLFMTCNTERHIIKNTFGIYHKPSITATLNDDKTIKKHLRSTLDSILSSDMDSKLQEEWMDMTKAERKLVHEEDGDLGLNTERLNNMLEKSKLHYLDIEQVINDAESFLKTGLTVATAMQQDIEKIKKKNKIK